MNPKKDGSLWYIVIFFYRRSLYVLFTFSMMSIPGVQVQVFIASSIVYFFFLYSVPVHAELMLWITETINEWIFMIQCYHIMCFANFVWDESTKKMIGTSLTVTIFLLLGINTSIILGVTIVQLKKKARLGYLKKNQKRRTDQRDAANEALRKAHIENY